MFSLFIVFSSRTVGLGGQFVLLGGFAVCVMHGELLCTRRTTPRAAVIYSGLRSLHLRRQILHSFTSECAFPSTSVNAFVIERQVELHVHYASLDLDIAGKVPLGRLEQC